LAQVDAVLEPGLQRTEHLAPALAVAVAGLEPTFIEAPAFLGNFDQSAAVVERLEGYRHLGLVADGRRLGAVGVLDVWRLALGGVPAQHDARVGDDLYHLDREGAGIVVEVPSHRGARREPPLRAAG